MTSNERTLSVVFAVVLAGAGGIALAQQGQGHGRSGPPPECVAGKHVVRPTPAATRALRTCHATSECVVVDAGCCAPCTMPTVAQLRAVRGDAGGAWRRHVCRGPTATCPACASPANADVTTECVRGLCELTVHDAACAPPTGMGVGHS